MVPFFFPGLDINTYAIFKRPCRNHSLKLSTYCSIYQSFVAIAIATSSRHCKEWLLNATSGG